MSSKADIKKAIIEKILMANPAGLTSREVFNQMEPSEQGRFQGGVTGVAKDLHYLRSKGVLDDGDADQGPNKWVLVQPESKKPDAPKKETTVPVSAYKLNDSLAEALVEKAGCLLLSPDNVLDAPFIEIITALRSAQEQPEPIKIERKFLKIDTLNRLSALMSDDIRVVLADISRDLAIMEEVNV